MSKARDLASNLSNIPSLEYEAVASPYYEFTHTTATGNAFAGYHYVPTPYTVSGTEHLAGEHTVRRVLPYESGTYTHDKSNYLSADATIASDAKAVSMTAHYWIHPEATLTVDGEFFLHDPQYVAVYD